MKEINALLFFICLNISVSYGQNDTITIYKVNYLEMNISAGWRCYFLKSGDSLIEFFHIESMDTSFRDMLTINPYDRNGKKLIHDLQKWNKRSEFEPLQYKNIGLLYIQTYHIVGELIVRPRNEILIDSVKDYDKTNVDIDDLKLILKRFD